MRPSSDNNLEMERLVEGPAFRWKRAKRLATLPRSARVKEEDERIQQASAYLRMCEDLGRDQADRKYPTLAAACGLTENEQSFELMKLSILGNLPRAEIAARLGAEQQTVELAEALFFDVEDFRGAPSWMNCHVFVLEAKFGSRELAAKMKVACYGGPVVTRALLDGQERLPLEEAQQIIDQEVLLHAKLQAALDIDLDAQSAAEFLKVFLEYDLQRKKLQFEREKFQRECEVAHDKRSADDADETKNESSHDAEGDQQSSSDDIRVRLTGGDSVGDDQRVA